MSLLDLFLMIFWWKVEVLATKGASSHKVGFEGCIWEQHRSFLGSFLTPSDFEGGPKIDSFKNKSENNEEKEVQETIPNNHDFCIDCSLNFGWNFVSFLMFF